MTFIKDLNEEDLERFKMAEETAALENKVIASYEAHISSGEQGFWDLPKMLEEFSEQSEEYKFDEKHERDEKEGTRTNIDRESRYSLKKGNQEGLILKINTYLSEDEFSVAVPSGLPKVSIELFDGNLRDLYDRLTARVDEIKEK